MTALTPERLDEIDGLVRCLNPGQEVRCDPDTIRALVSAARANAKLVEALNAIQDADEIELALDPGWPSRIAKAALDAADIKP